MKLKVCTSNGVTGSRRCCGSSPAACSTPCLEFLWGGYACMGVCML